MAPGALTARTVNSPAFGKLSNAGQTCIAPDYLLIHQDDVENFIALYDAAVKAFYPDGPASHDYGAIINDRHYHRLQDLLTDARARGARIVPVGHRPDSAAERPKTSPHADRRRPDDSRIMQEEIFGPLLPIRTYAAFDEAIDVINAGPRPLALYYFGPCGPCRTGCWRAPPPATSASTPPCCILPGRSTVRRHRPQRHGGLSRH